MGAKVNKSLNAKSLTMQQIQDRNNKKIIFHFHSQRLHSIYYNLIFYIVV